MSGRPTGVPLVRLVRRTSFSAAVRYQASAGMPADIYGSLSRLKGLGFNYFLEAYIEGEIDPLTGMIVNLADVDRWLKELTNELDHQVLNDVPAFAGQVPTAERIAFYCLRTLRHKVAAHGVKARLAKVRLHEGEGFWVDVFADD